MASRGPNSMEQYNASREALQFSLDSNEMYGSEPYWKAKFPKLSQVATLAQEFVKKSKEQVPIHTIIGSREA